MLGKEAANTEAFDLDTDILPVLEPFYLDMGPYALDMSSMDLELGPVDLGL